MPDCKEALITYIIVDARLYRLASDRFLTKEKYSLVKAGVSMECRFADQKVAVKFNETLTQSPSRVDVKV